MSERIPCRVEHLVVRPEVRETVDNLIFKMFERRNHHFVAGQEQHWLTVELIQSVRRESSVYREELSTKTSGPIPFALGYFRLEDGRLELTTDTVPANMAPKTFVRFLSEFLEPGAQLWFGPSGDEEGWEIRGPDDLRSVEKEPPSIC